MCFGTWSANLRGRGVSPPPIHHWNHVWHDKAKKNMHVFNVTRQTLFFHPDRKAFYGIIIFKNLNFVFFWNQIWNKMINNSWKCV